MKPGETVSTAFDVVLERHVSSDVGEAELLERLRATPIDATAGFAYIERLDSVRLIAAAEALASDGPVGGSLAGRLFDAKRELRWWLHQQKGVYSVWSVVEGAGNEPARATDRRHYLRGELATTGGAPTELRFRDAALRVELSYPVDVEHALEGDRAYVLVREYRSPRPSPWPANVADAIELLNRPLVIARRFVTVACGRD